MYRSHIIHLLNATAKRTGYVIAMRDEKIRQIISRAARDMSGISQRADEYMTRAKKTGSHIQYSDDSKSSNGSYSDGKMKKRN